jgi:radical SAM-linked protein
MEKLNSAPLQGSQALSALQAMLAAPPPEGDPLEQLLVELEQEQRLEHALLLLKEARLDPGLWGGFRARLKARVEASRARRMSRWQGDPERRSLRLRFEVLAPACGQHPAGLVALLARTLMAAGLPVAMGLEKSPRPALHLGHPLPLQVEGFSEWADVVLLENVPVALAELPARINAQAPQGLRILECLQVPNFASPVAELCQRAHWRWRCPAEWLERARARMDRFVASERFEIEKPAKVQGQKASKLLDIRPLVAECRWDGTDLLFQTRIAPGEAANPRKLLAAILDLGVPIEGLARLGVELGEDPRLLQADKFQPKLHNMFEDAVLLDSGSHIRIVEDDDEEPIRLGS